MTLEQLREPGPARSAATAAIVGTLRMDLTVCRDRAEAIAPRILDRALGAAAATAPAPPAAAMIPVEAVAVYLDDVIRRWRAIRDGGESESKAIAAEYIDAFQSARVSLVGEALPPPELDEL